MYVAGGVDQWTCGLWVVDRISIMYVAGGVDQWTCGLWVVDRRSNMYVAGGVDKWVVGCGQFMYIAIGVDPSRNTDLR